MLCTKGHVCDIEHIIYILCKNAYDHFAIFVTRNIYANVKLHFYNRENISYELFYKNYSSCPIIGESHNICVSCSYPWVVPFSFSFVQIFDN